MLRSAPPGWARRGPESELINWINLIRLSFVYVHKNKIWPGWLPGPGPSLAWLPGWPVWKPQREACARRGWQIWTSHFPFVSFSFLYLGLVILSFVKPTYELWAYDIRRNYKWHVVKWEMIHWEMNNDIRTNDLLRNEKPKIGQMTNPEYDKWKTQNRTNENPKIGQMKSPK